MPDTDYRDFVEAIEAANAARDNTRLDPYVRDDDEILALRAAVEAASSILGIDA